MLLGGSPLRLFRISERARQLVGRWRAGARVGPGRGAQMLARRLVSAGAFSPRPRAGRSGPGTSRSWCPVRDRPAPLDRLLGALGGLACIVVDDASADAGATKEIAERHGARFVGLDTNAGPAGARNAGLAAVDSALVAFVDSDCVPDDGWLGPLLGHFDDPLVAAVAPRIVPAPVAATRRARPTPRRCARRSTVGPGRGRCASGAPSPSSPSAALLVRVDAVTGPDLFDAALRGGEDVDLVWRLGEAGWDVRYVPSSTVAHDGPGDTGVAPGPPGLLRDDGRAAGPPPRGRAGPGPPVRLVAGGVGARAGPPARAGPDRARRVRRHPRPPPTRPRARPRRRGRAHRGRRHRAGRPCPPSARSTRAWSPALVLGLAFRRTRAAAALALLVPALADWAADRQALDPVRAMAVHVADDVAYGTGVWVGCAGERTLAPLVPRISWRARVWSSPALREELQPPAERAEPSLAIWTCPDAGEPAAHGALPLREAELPGLDLPVRRPPEGHGGGVGADDDRMRPARPELAQTSSAARRSDRPSPWRRWSGATASR